MKLKMGKKGELEFAQIDSNSMIISDKLPIF